MGTTYHLSESPVKVKADVGEESTGMTAFEYCSSPSDAESLSKGQTKLSSSFSWAPLSSGWFTGTGFFPLSLLPPCTIDSSCGVRDDPCPSSPSFKMRYCSENRQGSGEPKVSMCFPTETRKTAAGSTLGLLIDREGGIDGGNSASSKDELAVINGVPYGL